MFRAMFRLSQGMAMLGGAVLLAMIVLTVLSVIGREANAFLNGDAMQAHAKGAADALIALGINTVKGDTEIVQAGIAFAIFAFLPLCQITGSHASVDIVTARMGPGMNRWLRVGADIAMAVVLVLIAHRLADGTFSKWRVGETTLFLQFPVWWAFGASLIGACVAASVAVYVATARLLGAITGRPDLPTSIQEPPRDCH
ncbi:MAG: TRAP transporter small permease [Paracoccaceae bacterium]